MSEVNSRDETRNVVTDLGERPEWVKDSIKGISTQKDRLVKYMSKLEEDNKRLREVVEVQRLNSPDKSAKIEKTRDGECDECNKDMNKSIGIMLKMHRLVSIVNGEGIFSKVTWKKEEDGLRMARVGFDLQLDQVGCSVIFLADNSDKDYGVELNKEKDIIAFMLPTDKLQLKRGLISKQRFDRGADDEEDKYTLRVWGGINEDITDFEALFRCSEESPLLDLEAMLFPVKTTVYIRGSVGEREISDLPFYEKLKDHLSPYKIDLKESSTEREKGLSGDEKYLLLCLYIQSPLGIPEEELWEKWVAHAHSLCSNNAVWLILKHEDYIHDIKRTALDRSGIFMDESKEKQVPALLKANYKSGFVLNPISLKRLKRKVFELAYRLAKN